MTPEPIKILLVDDREDNLLSMELVLEKDGYSFTRASSGREALKILLKDHDFSLILLDVKMPIMDGYETAEIIHQREKLKHIPIIFITGQDYEEAAVFKGYQLGAVDYISKPFNPQILRSKVAVFIDLFKKNRLLKQQDEKLRSINEDLIILNRKLENRVKERTLELEKLNQELKQLNIAKDNFLSVISHDLRNPLTALLATSQKLSKDADKCSPAEIAALSALIHRTSKKILSQLNDLVDWAKKQHEKTSFKPEPIHLAKKIDKALELLKDNAAQKEIALQNQVSREIYVNADPPMLRSILQNLVTNAIKYTEPGGFVKITATPAHNMVEICVQDSGVGMAIEMQQKLLAKSGADSDSVSGTNNEPGTGLGLLLVKDFVAQHGGSLQVESELGKGSIFKFTIPREPFEN